MKKEEGNSGRNKPDLCDTVLSQDMLGAVE